MPNFGFLMKIFKIKHLSFKFHKIQNKLCRYDVFFDTEQVYLMKEVRLNQYNFIQLDIFSNFTNKILQIAMIL